MEQLEYHLKELMKLMKKLYTSCLYLVFFLIILFILFIYLKFYEDLLGLLIFILLLIIVFSIELIYGINKYNRFKWILNNYKINKKLCLELLQLKNINLNIQTDIKDDKNLPFSVKISYHIKKAHDYLIKI